MTDRGSNTSLYLFFAGASIFMALWVMLMAAMVVGRIWG